MNSCKHNWVVRNSRMHQCTKCESLGYIAIKNYGYVGHRNIKKGDIVPFKCGDRCGNNAQIIRHASINLWLCKECDSKRIVPDIKFDSELQKIKEDEIKDQIANEHAFEQLRMSTLKALQ